MRADHERQPPVILQSELRCTVGLEKLVEDQKRGYAARTALGAKIQPGPLNFMHGKILHFSPVREESQFSEFQKLNSFFSAEQVAFMRSLPGHDAEMERQWVRVQRMAYFEMLRRYSAAVLKLHTDLLTSRRADLTEVIKDKLSVWAWLVEMRIAGGISVVHLATAGWMVRLAILRIERATMSLVPAS